MKIEYKGYVIHAHSFKKASKFEGDYSIFQNTNVYIIYADVEKGEGLIKNLINTVKLEIDDAV